MRAGFKAQKKLLSWFKKNQRDLPWRKQEKSPPKVKRDPYAFAYKVWLSEVMLQQTTSKAVIPYYKNFLKKFPTLKDLAKARESEVLSAWSGLGYYSRAKNLLKTSRLLDKQKAFPKTYKELLKLPGFGDYTARAVSSLAFGEVVGVLDANVIRFLSRFYGLKIEHWKTPERAKLQSLSDAWVKASVKGEQGAGPPASSSKVNQALMEIGALICVSSQPFCLLCPVRAECTAYKKSLQNELPLKKEKKAPEFWLYQVERIQNPQKRWAFVLNQSLPFLKGQLVFPGKAKKIPQKPKHYDIKHSIMHYQIFVSINSKPSYKKSLYCKKVTGFSWHNQQEIQKLNPSSLITKILQFPPDKGG